MWRARAGPFRLKTPRGFSGARTSRSSTCARSGNGSGPAPFRARFMRPMANFRTISASAWAASFTSSRGQARRSSFIAHSASVRRWPFRRPRIRGSRRAATSRAECPPGRRPAARRIDLGRGLSLAKTRRQREISVPKIKVNDITMNYETQGSGEPLVLIPYLAADNACYAFQVADYSKHFTCISLDPRGAGETDKPDGTYSTELFADDVAAFMGTIGVEKAHVSGLSLGGAIGLWLASKNPELVKTLSAHSCWPKSDPFLKVIVGDWQT